MYCFIPVLTNFSFLFFQSKNLLVISIVKNIVNFRCLVYHKNLTMNKITLVFVAYAFFSISCLKNIICIDGNGQLATESRQVPEITEIVNTTSVDVIYKKGDSVSVTITAESNLIEHIVTSSAGGRLEIRTDPRNTCFDYTIRPFITITSPEVTSLDLTGSGSLDADSLAGSMVEIRSTGSGNLRTGYIDSDDLKVSLTGSGDVSVSAAECLETDFTITGSGNFEIAGKADIGVMRVTGSGDIKSVDFPLVVATETITGSGNIYTTVLNTLTAVISGSGNIYVRGNPTVNKTVTGSGRVLDY